ADEAPVEIGLVQLREGDDLRHRQANAQRAAPFGPAVAHAPRRLAETDAAERQFAVQALRILEAAGARETADVERRQRAHLDRVLDLFVVLARGRRTHEREAQRRRESVAQGGLE